MGILSICAIFLFVGCSDERELSKDDFCLKEGYTNWGYLVYGDSSFDFVCSRNHDEVSRVYHPEELLLINNKVCHKCEHQKTIKNYKCE